MTKPVRAPRHLSPTSRRLFADVTSSYVLEPHHVAILTKALEAFDRAEQARALVDAEGLIVLSRLNESKAHPAIPIERDSRAQFFAGMRQLGLDVESPATPSPRR